MKRTLAVTCLLWMLIWSGLGVWGACPANNPNNPFALTMQGGDPTGNAGYPIAVVGATGCPLDVNIAAFGANPCVTQCTSPWVVGFNGVSQPVNVTGPNLTVDTPIFGNGSFPKTLPGIVSISCGYNYLEGANGFINPLATSPGDGVGSNSARTVLSVQPSLANFNNCTPIQSTATYLDGGTGGSSYALPPSQSYLYNGGTFSNGYERQRTPKVFRTVTATVAGNTVAWAPTIGTKFRLMRYQIIVTDNATQAAPGTLTVSLNDAGVALNQVHPVFVPAIGLVNSGSLYSSPWIDLGNGELSAATGNVLNVNLSAALTAGQVQVNLCGTEE